MSSQHFDLDYDEAMLLFTAVADLWGKRRDNLARAFYDKKPERTVASIQRRFDEVDRLHTRVRLFVIELGTQPAEEAA